ncbi:MAG: hypothetical protein ACKORG_08860 [Actinomycetota bacterium]
MADGRDLVADGFTETASDYEDAVRFNIEGGQRLVMSIPAGHYDDVLDVGCGTGWTTQAIVDRFRRRGSRALTRRRACSSSSRRSSAASTAWR